MGIVSGVVVYLCVWWLVFFTVLPWGVHVPDQSEPGHADSAPERPRLWMKAAITTGIAAVVWFVIDFVIRTDLIAVR